MSGTPIEDGDPTVVASASEASVPRRDTVELGAGTHIDRYIVLERLGAGGMGVVYAAFDPSLDRKIALKLLRTRAGGSQGVAARGRLLREARAMAQLRSPNVVAVYDVGEHSGHVWVAMEFIEGVTLRRWLREAPRSWREVLETFVLAGRGLAAAHACGFVHRDFKPDNVMIQHADGKTPAAERVRVMDFGLARPVRGPDPLQPVELTSASADPADALELTRDGAIVGTPGYMAPEQHESARATAAADQFSFCVALWEALYGHRPFAGDSPSEIVASISQGNMRTPPGGSRVPAWVRSVVERGLAIAPADRWPTLDALLVALRRDPTHRQRKLWAMLGAVSIAAAGYGVLEARAARQAAACEATSGEIAAVWNPDVADTLRRTFAAAGDDGATFDRTRTWIDAEAEAWRHARVELCRASEIESRFDPHTSEAAQACLEEHRGRLSSVLDALLGVDSASLRLAVLAAADLPRADACTDVRSLALRAPPPQDAAKRAAVAEVRAELWRADAVALTGDAEEALEIVAATQSRVAELGNVPLAIEAHLAHAHRLSEVGRWAEAEAQLHEVLTTAIEARDGPSSMRAASGLAFLVGYQLRRLPEGLRWGELSLAMLRALPDPPDAERIIVLRNLAVLQYLDGEQEQAIEAFTEVMQLQTAILGPDHPDLANALHNLGAAYVGVGELERARQMYEREAELLESQLGGDDPELAETLVGLASVHARTGSPDDALALLQRALEIQVASLGPEHPAVAESLGRLGEHHLSHERPAEALPLQERALAIEQRHHGAAHPRLLRPLLGIAKTQLEVGSSEAAVTTSERALAIAANADESPYNLAALRFVAAQARLAAGTDREAALALAREAHDTAHALGPAGSELTAEIAAFLAAEE
jgi:tetratricopeptide (TPR) repeat protein